MPWTQRAFLFNRMSSISSIYYVGVFKHDTRPFKHHGCGRFAIDIREFEPITIYTLKYNLFSSPLLANRKCKDIITIRLQIYNYIPPCNVLDLSRAPKIQLNVKSRKTLAIMRYTCYGKHREDVYNSRILESYIDEILKNLERFSFELHVGFESLIFWKSQVKIWKFEIPFLHF